MLACWKVDPVEEPGRRREILSFVFGRSAQSAFNGGQLHTPWLAGDGAARKRSRWCNDRLDNGPAGGRRATGEGKVFAGLEVSR